MNDNRPRKPATDHRDLVVWQLAMELAQRTYEITSRFLTSEHFGLVAQVRRSAVSIPANIAEGNGRTHRKEYLHHLSIARGSLRETGTLWDLAHRLEFVETPSYEVTAEMLDRISRMLTQLIRALQR